MATESTVAATGAAEPISSDDDRPPPQESKSLKIPITSSSSASDLFIEIFPDELHDVSSSTLLHVLRDEDADLDVWADAALHYIQQHHAQQSSSLLQAACDRPGGNREHRVRVLASAGIAHLTQAASTTTSTSTNAQEAQDELRTLADHRFTHAGKVDTLFPMTWMGRGMLNLSVGRMDQAKFFFDTTLKQCGKVLPALLGMAAVLFGEGNFKGAQEFYGKAMQLYPSTSGAATRVGFGMACYQLGQVDRAKAAFQRALEMDPENVQGMVGAAILEMASLDPSSKDYRARTEKAIKLLSMANLLDHSNAMVQNHLANHYFWKWTPLPGTVKVSQGSKIVVGSQPIPLDPGERIRVGTDFESHVAEDVADDYGDVNTTFSMRHPWEGGSVSGLKLWKKDYDRVVALAKGAYNSTRVPEIQAESLFLLARVHHVRENYEDARKLYERACKFAPNLQPARFGLSQTLIALDEYKEAAAHLRLVLGTSSTATEAMAVLGLLEVKEGINVKEGLSYLKKAIDMDPLNADLILFEALALQQQKSTYPQSLIRYQKAVELLESQRKKVSYSIYNNIGVLSHELGKFDEALDLYTTALESIDGDGNARQASLEDCGVEGGSILHKDNAMFFGYVDSNFVCDFSAQSPTTVLKLVGLAMAGTPLSHPFRKGDHVRFGDEFESEIVAVGLDGDKLTVEIRDTFSPVSKQPESEGVVKIPVMVKRQNHRLEDPRAMSIAFNLARLHESAGRKLAAVELHKAIVKRNPAYVNSHLRLACIARDCGSLKECSAWLKIACAAAPGNAEVLILVGNLHLSLCDWAPAQSVFDQLLTQKVPNVESYAMLSLGNIYFSNLKSVPKKYAKHLQYSADYYKRILSKDKANAYAANGIGTVLAEKGELIKAKEIFNRVREISGDSIADVLLNLGHIYLAQKKHPEALQMYQSYMKRTEDGTAPVTTKNRSDDMVEVLLCIALAYFDWARQTELFNDARAAPADERYKKCTEHLQLALVKTTRKQIVIGYNICMTKLQAANCVLQKLTRSIRRTANEVEEALHGLEESLPKVQQLLQRKSDGDKKIPIQTSMLQDFITHCKANIESARSHLEEERRREAEVNEIRQLQLKAAEMKREEEDQRKAMEREEEARAQEERDRKAEEKMKQVDQLRAGWEKEAEAKRRAAEKRKGQPGEEDLPLVEEGGLFSDDVAVADTSALFEDSDDEVIVNETDVEQPALNDNVRDVSVSEPFQSTEKDLFGESSDGSDEELIPSGTKRTIVEDEGISSKKRRVLDEDE